MRVVLNTGYVLVFSAFTGIVGTVVLVGGFGSQTERDLAKCRLKAVEQHETQGSEFVPACMQDLGYVYHPAFDRNDPNFDTFEVLLYTTRPGTWTGLKEEARYAAAGGLWVRPNWMRERRGFQ